MTLIISSAFNGVSDPDAAAYIQAVEAADGELLEFAVGKAINDFVLGCKADGIWDAIKASCILAGARTLNGTLVPLVGTAPTNFNFVAGDYNRKTGLVGDGSTKYLDSNRLSTAEFALVQGSTTATTPEEYFAGSVVETVRQRAEIYKVGPYYVGTVDPQFNADGTLYGVVDTDTTTDGEVTV